MSRAPVSGQDGGNGVAVPSDMARTARRNRAAAAVLILAVGIGPVAAGDAFEALPVLDPALETKGWRVLTRDDITPNRFKLARGGAIEVRTAGSNALIYRPVPEDKRFATRFRWRWRVDRTTPPTNIQVKGGDDRPVSVYLGFEAPPGSRGLFDRIRNALAELVVGVPISGYALTYTWGGTSPVGTVFNNPHLRDDSYVFVRRNAGTPLMKWLSEEVDIAADFRAAFGIAATPIRFIAIAADSEDTGGASTALVDRLELVGTAAR